MTTQILSRKARISAIITALVMFITALCCMARPTFALADDDDNEYDIDPDHVCTDDCYENIYYLTDNPSAEYYVDTFLNGLVDRYEHQHSVFNEFKYYDLAAIGEQPWRYTLERERFGEPTWDFDSNYISNALVIYELNELLPFQFSGYVPYFPTYKLYDTFLKMKRSNCRIMFICNTDETIYNSDNESNKFLDLVDVHINTDIYSFFTQTFLTLFTEKGIRNSTIILDQSMAQFAVTGDWVYCSYDENGYRRAHPDVDDDYACKLGSRYGFIDGTLLPYIRKMLGLPRTGIYQHNQDLLRTQDINILCYLGDDTFFDLNYGTPYYLSIDNQKFSEEYKSDYYYFVGSTRYGNSYELRNLLMSIEEKEDYRGMFDMYLFVEYGSYQTVKGESKMHVAGMDNRSMANFIAPFVFFFLFDDIYDINWSAISNWGGRGDVTIKPTGEDSWLLPLSDSDDIIDPDDEALYYGD